MKYLRLSFLIIIFLLETTLPASAVQSSPQDYEDLLIQYTSVNNNNLAEHWVFTNQYTLAFLSSSSRSWKWYAYDFATEANTANSRWNAANDSAIADSVKTTSVSEANLKYYWGTCPGGAPGCFLVSTWDVHGTLGVNIWRYADIVIDPTPNNGYNWSTSGLTAAVLHETGHAWGLGEQYINQSCNSNLYSVMDALKVVGNDLYPCDTEFVSSSDQTKLNAYYLEGVYTKISISKSAGNVTSTWKDTVWMDYNTEYWWYWRSTPTGAPTIFKIGSQMGNNGSHDAVTESTLPDLTFTIKPSDYGVPTNKYISVCVKPYFNADFGTGNLVCSSQIIFP